MLIEVLICTIDERIAQATEVLLPQQTDVCYLISWQRTEEAVIVPPILQERSDVRVVEHRSTGLSRNRNEALRHAKGDILLIADDDLCYTPTAFDDIRAYFLANPNIDLLTTKVKHADDAWHKNYPATSCLIKDAPRGYFVSSVELALRRSSILPRFDERFGLGSAMLASGEEEVFVLDCIRKGLVATFSPLHTATLRGTQTTGQYFETQTKVRRSKGAVLMYRYGRWGAYLRCAKFVCCYRGSLSKWQVWCDLLWGIHYIANDV